jgi:geranylgeranyl diphosphate synthase, type II
MKNLDEFSELYEIIQSSIAQLKIDDEPKELYQPIQYSLDVGGKRIRPILVLAACKMFSDDIKPAIAPALAIEIFHNFTLLHDDIMDKADLRRNMPTVHKKWSENVAILSGDAMMIKAYEQIIKAPAQNLITIVELFNKTAIEVCEGQQLDMNFESRKTVTENEYIEMIRLKTSVLLAASLKIGALSGFAGESDADKLYNFGLNLGLAFQLQDDYLDVYGDQQKFGKKIGGDIVANKKTYLLIKAAELAGKEDRSTITKLLTDHNIEAEFKIKSMISIFNKLKIKQLVKEKMELYYSQAMQAINSVDVIHSNKILLIEFANKLMERER